MSNERRNNQLYRPLYVLDHVLARDDDICGAGIFPEAEQTGSGSGQTWR